MILAFVFACSLADPLECVALEFVYEGLGGLEQCQAYEAEISAELLASDGLVVDGLYCVEEVPA